MGSKCCVMIGIAILDQGCPTVLVARKHATVICSHLRVMIGRANPGLDCTTVLLALLAAMTKYVMIVTAILDQFCRWVLLVLGFPRPHCPWVAVLYRDGGAWLTAVSTITRSLEDLFLFCLLFMFGQYMFLCFLDMSAA